MRKIQFIIGHLEYVGNKKFMVAGRNCLDELRKGDVLKLINSFEDTDQLFPVAEIKMFDNPVEEVPRGFSAGIFFNNDMFCF